MSASAILREFAREAVRDRVEALLDDPGGVLGSDRSLAAYVDHLTAVCLEIDLSFDALVQELGTVTERDRLRDMLQPGATTSPATGSAGVQ